MFVDPSFDFFDDLVVELFGLLESGEGVFVTADRSEAVVGVVDADVFGLARIATVEEVNDHVVVFFRGDKVVLSPDSEGRAIDLGPPFGVVVASELAPEVDGASLHGLGLGEGGVEGGFEAREDFGEVVGVFAFGENPGVNEGVVAGGLASGDRVCPAEDLLSAHVLEPILVPGFEDGGGGDETGDGFFSDDFRAEEAAHAVSEDEDAVGVDEGVLLNRFEGLKVNVGFGVEVGCGVGAAFGVTHAGLFDAECDKAPRWQSDGRNRRRVRCR